MQTFRADKATVAAGTFEGRSVTTVEGVWRDDRRDIDVGALFVPIAQPKARLAQDTALKEEFERRLRDDAAFAGNPDARLEFFYRRHPSWDERYGLYPVYRN